MAKALNQNRQQDTRNQTLDTALRLFTSKGFFNTSVQDIRKEANVSIGSIYHHFRSKEELARALYQDLVDRMEEMFSAIISRRTSTRERVEEIIDTLLTVAETSPREMQFLLCAKHREFLPCEKPLCLSRPFEILQEVVTTGIDQGEICDLDPVVASSALFGGALRLIHLKLDGALTGPLDQYRDETVECAWAAVT